MTKGVVSLWREFDPLVRALLRWFRLSNDVAINVFWASGAARRLCRDIQSAQAPSASGDAPAVGQEGRLRHRRLFGPEAAPDPVGVGFVDT